jgi:outer membrane protein OmpA-like peptidoglycan-associated protein
VASPCAAQDLRSGLFEKADQAMAQAREAHADVLAPKNFSEAEKRYRQAEEKFSKGKDISEIEKDLKQAVAYLNKAIEATKLAEVMFADTFRARSDAMKADAENYSADLWGKAQQKFMEAARNLEEGDASDAKDQGFEAEKLYRDAELDAIKNNFFTETRKLLTSAEKEKADKYAPQTYAYARDLLDQAESALNENRYDTDKPRSLAREAKSEAKHALHITDIVRNMDRRDVTVEELILDSEKPLADIANAADIVPNFEEGFTQTTTEILGWIKKMETANLTMEQENQELAAQNATLQQKLGGITEERQAMEIQLAAEAETKKKIAQVEATFTPEEAKIFREQGQIYVRLIGLTFASGKAVIRPEHFGLLTKVQDAIQVFPDCQVRIEGHTDSFGTDSMNLQLSQERAVAVREYLVANMRLAPQSIEAIGYGETRPIANNETQEGRTKNRRIDVVIVPQQ